MKLSFPLLPFESAKLAFQMAIAAGTICAIATVKPDSSYAQIVPDNTAGTTTAIDGNTTHIQGGTQTGANLIHSFGEFSVPTGETANFLTNPNIDNVLSRVTGGNISVIDGLVSVTGSNANLFLMNPAGIVFGHNASLNVPADFIATTATGIGFDNGWFGLENETNWSQLVGDPTGLDFSDPRSGSIINEGSLAVAEGHQLGLFGRTIANTGTLQAPGGVVTVAAVPDGYLSMSVPGSLLSLQFTPDAISSSEQSTIAPLSLPELLTAGVGTHASQIEVNTDGTIAVSGSGMRVDPTDGTVVASGTIDVSSQQGGAIDIWGDRVALVNAILDASGDNSGGNIRIGGDYQGLGSVLNASQTFISRDTSIIADALQTGDGGEVIIWADGTTRFFGDISSRGGAEFGDGGFVEVSGKDTLVFRGTVDVGAENGITGTILLDPKNIVIVAGDSAPDDSELDDGSIFAGDGDPDATFTISQETLESLTGTIVLEATNDITVDISDSLTFTDTNGNGSITFTADSDMDGTGSFLVGASPAIFTNGRDITITGAEINLGTTEIFTEGGTISLTATNGNIVADLLTTEDYAAGGDAGDLFLNANNGNIQTQRLDVSTQTGKPGSVQISGIDITIREIDADVHDVENSGGTVTIEATGTVNIIDSIDTRSRFVGDGGTIEITAELDISLGPIQSTALDGNGGAVTINSLQGSIDLRGGLNSGTFTTGTGGSVHLEAALDVHTNEIFTGSHLGNAGGITIIAGRELSITSGYLSFYLYQSIDCDAAGVQCNDSDRSVTIDLSEIDPDDFPGLELLSQDLSTGEIRLVPKTPISNDSNDSSGDDTATQTSTGDGSDTTTSGGDDTTTTQTSTGDGSDTTTSGGDDTTTTQTSTGDGSDTTTSGGDDTTTTQTSTGDGSDTTTSGGDDTTNTQTSTGDETNIASSGGSDTNTDTQTSTNTLEPIEGLTLILEELDLFVTNPILATISIEGEGGDVSLTARGNIEAQSNPPTVEQIDNPELFDGSPDLSEAANAAAEFQRQTTTIVTVGAVASGDVSVVAGGNVNLGKINTDSFQGIDGNVSILAGGTIDVGDIVSGDGAVTILENVPPIAPLSIVPLDDVIALNSLTEDAIEISVPPDPLPEEPPFLEVEVAEPAETVLLGQDERGNPIIGPSTQTPSKQDIEPKPIITAISPPPTTDISNQEDPPDFIPEDDSIPDDLDFWFPGVEVDRQIVREIESGLIDIEDLRLDEYSDEFGDEISEDEAMTPAQVRQVLGQIEAQTGLKPGVVYAISLPHNRFQQVDFQAGEELLALVLVSFGGETFARSVVVEEASLEIYVDRLMSELKDGNGRSYLGHSKGLYQLLIEPLRPVLEERHIDTLMFSMDSGLRRVPMGALHDGEQFVIENFKVSTIPSVTLTDARYQSIKETEVLAMGASHYSIDSDRYYPGIPVALEAIFQWWRGNLFLNQDFTLENLQRQRRNDNYGIVHLGTHAQFFPPDSEKSDVLNSDDAHILFWDAKESIADLRENNWYGDYPVELLVLHACETAIGTIEQELGFAGLAVRAGVKSVIASVWQVNDAATMALMSEFYYQLHRQEVPIKAEALRQAQIALINGKVRIEGDRLIGDGWEMPLPPDVAGDRRFSHPYHWAGFTTIGSPW